MCIKKTLCEITQINTNSEVALCVLLLLHNTQINNLYSTVHVDLCLLVVAWYFFASGNKLLHVHVHVVLLKKLRFPLTCFSNFILHSLHVSLRTRFHVNGLGMGERGQDCGKKLDPLITVSTSQTKNLLHLH